MSLIYNEKLSVTPAAIEKIQSILQNTEVFRIKIEPGGCNGFEYHFSIEKSDADKSNSEDSDYKILENNNAIIVIDKNSLTLLNGATLDYESELIGEKFSIKNPNSKSSCSCGGSFGL